MNKIGETQAGTFIVEMTRDDWIRINSIPIAKTDVSFVDPEVTYRFLAWLLGSREHALANDVRTWPMIQDILNQVRSYPAQEILVDVIENRLGLIPPYQPMTRRACAEKLGLSVDEVTKMQSKLARMLRHPFRSRRLLEISRELEEI